MTDGTVNPVEPGTTQNEGNPENGGGTWSIVKSMFKRIILFYFISNLMKTFFGGNQPTNTGPSSSSGAMSSVSGMNVFQLHQPLDFYMYLSESKSVFTDFDNNDALFWKHSGFRYGDWEEFNPTGYITHSKTFKTPEYLQKNQSMYLHVFVTKSSGSPNPKSRLYQRHETIYGMHKLNKYKKKHYKRTANLLTGKSDIPEEELVKADKMKYEVLNFWHPNLTVNLVYDFTQLAANTLPAPFDKYIKFDDKTRTYKPILYFNNYWNLNSEYSPINETVDEVTLSLSFQPLSFFKFQMYASQSEKSQWQTLLSGDSVGDGDDDGQDSIKTALLETNVYLLGLTVIVSILHTIFEMLAFKNDIQFWKDKKSVEGLSVRTVLMNTVQQFIMLLYIIDNDTNFMIRISGFVGLGIELWKVPKCMNVSIDYTNKLFGVIPKIKLEDKGTYVESSTAEYDALAFKYLSWVCFPLLGGYAIYSLIYQEQKGWYSWVLNMLYGYLLTFGFIMMTPQLFINYKLKSVSHLPWRMLTYKFINTFIDDLFAFVIKLPILYRIGCFRDDIIFLIYLYQRWIYRVDPKRVNEYGVSGEQLQQLETENEVKAIEKVEEESKKDR